MKAPGILFEDNHLLVVEKPVNMPVQADASGDDDLFTLLKAYIKKKYNKPGAVYLGLVHRLDRPVGGVMVFARTSKAASRLSKQFASGEAKKRYAAIVCGHTKAEDRLSCHIVKDGQTGTSRVATEYEDGAKPAALFYRKIAEKSGLALIDIELFTGRHHQIRVQTAHAGFPIWGDQRYNPCAKAGEQIALFAYSLTITHPTTKECLMFTASPKGGAWPYFGGALPPLLAGVHVVYSDENLIVVNKQAGISVAKADGGADTLENRLNGVFGAVYPVHRLDAATTGLVLFARNPAARESLDEAIRRRKIRKFYQCIVKGVPSAKEAALTAWGVKDEARARLTVSDSPVPGAKQLQLRYRVLSTENGLSLLEAELITGRTHQIRAQLGHIGHPLLGDDKYGDRAFNQQKKCTALSLCAVRLELNFGADDILSCLDGKVFQISPPFSF